MLSPNTATQIPLVAVAHQIPNFPYQHTQLILSRVFAPLLIAAMLIIPDPAGDANGNGTYVLPQRPVLTSDAFDIRSFSAQKNDIHMRFIISFGQMINPWKSPAGFSAGVTDIFIKSGFLGIQNLADIGLSAKNSSGWNYHLRISGYGSTLDTAQTDNSLKRLSAPVVTIEGTSLVIDTEIPVGKYGYWVTNSVYSPFTSNGLMTPKVSNDPNDLQASQDGLPLPIDILSSTDDRSAYTTIKLAPLGETRDWTTLILAGLGGFGLLITILATIGVWRKVHRQ